MVVFQVKAHKDLVHFETAYVVKIHNAARLAPCQPVRFFSFSLISFFDLNLSINLITMLFEVHALFQILVCMLIMSSVVLS